MSKKLDIIDVKDFDTKYILEILELTKQIKTKYKNPDFQFRDFLYGKIFATLFFEASTRTRLSFESAIQRLGGKLITVENGKENSSQSKGESLEDTIKTVEQYCDAIVIRHSEDNSSVVAAKISKIPVINAGSGKSSHPTQALLDAFTIWERFGRLQKLNIVIIGDLLRGRTVYSLISLLIKFKGNKFTFVSSKNSRINEEFRKLLKSLKIKFSETDNLKKAVANADIIYVTRVQRERCKDDNEYQEAKKSGTIDKGILQFIPREAIIMHPLPRVDEISLAVDRDKRAVYFEQVANGVPVRMAILIKLFK